MDQREWPRWRFRASRACGVHKTDNLHYSSNDGSLVRDAQSVPDPSCLRAVRREVYALLRAHSPNTRLRRMVDPRIDRVTVLATEDLLALTSRDPASLGRWRYVLDCYASYRATLAYRLAHAAFLQTSGLDPELARNLLALARRISESAKVDTGVEIHPAATIGRRFVLDHAAGTVIGETAVLGDDCYLLQGVVLGATGIALNQAGKRHPSLGSHVEVGAFARILGPVCIGDSVFIGPGAVVTTSLPSGSRVRVINQCQVSRPVGRAQVFGVVPKNASEIAIHGTTLSGVQASLVAAEGRAATHLSLDLLHSSDDILTCRIYGDIGPVDESLRLAEPTGSEVVVTQLEPVWRHMRSLREADDRSLIGGGS